MVRNYTDEAVPREVVERIVAGMPTDVAVVGVVTIGHAAPDPRSGSRKRGWKPLEEVVRWERW